VWQFREEGGGGGEEGEEGETGGSRRGRGGEEVKGACQDVGRDNSPGDTFPS